MCSEGLLVPDSNILKVQDKIWDTIPATHLADQVATKLGYRYLQEKSGLTQYRQILKQATFHDALVTLGITPYTSESVQRYKEAKKKEMELLSFIPGSRLNRVCNLAHSIGLAIYIIVYMLTVPLFILYMVLEAPHFFFPLFLFLGLLGLVIMFITGVVNHFTTWPIQKNYSWCTYPMHEYKQIVPDFALHKALQIKAQFPETEFRVIALEEQRNICDPLLVAVYYGREYCFAIWNEPSFRGNEGGEN